MIQKILKATLSFIIIFASSTAIAVAQYQFDTWTTANGLPQNSVNGVVQTPDGYLWLATFDGLARFDGLHFTVFDKGNSKGIVNNRFKGIYADHAGAVWAFTESGILTVYRKGVFESYETPEGLSETILKISEDEKNRLIITTQKKLYYFHDGAFLPLPAEKQRNPLASFSGKPGSVWIIKPKVIVHQKNGTETFYPLNLKLELAKVLPYVNDSNPDELFQAGASLNSFEDSLGTLWICGFSNRLFRLRDGTIEIFTFADIFGSEKPFHFRPFIVLDDEKGNLWFSSGYNVFTSDKMDKTETRLIKYDGKSFKSIESNFFFSGGLKDREGNLWLATIGNGLIRLNKRVITTLADKDGLAGNEVYPLIQTRRGDIFIGTTNGVNLYRDGRLSILENLKIPNISSIPLARSFWENEAGALYISYYGGFGQIENDLSLKILKQNVVDGFTDFEVDSDGWVWAANENGLYKFHEDRPDELFNVGAGLPHKTAITLHKDRNGTLWVGTAKGLSRFENGKFTNYGESDGMPEDFIREIYEDADGVLWIGTYSSGLVRYKDGKFFRFTVENGLFNNGVFTIIEDERGNFWMSCNRGIYRVNKKELSNVADGKLAKVGSFSYGISDGMLSTEANGGRHPSAVKAKDGKIWFPTMGGVAIVDPNAETFNPEPPPVAIENISIDRKKLDAPDVYAAAHDPNKVVEMQPGQTSLEIDYTGLSLIKSEQMKFKYKLEGLEEDWVEDGATRAANYSYLPHGEYTFRVIAANASGVWNKQGVAIRINVLPFFYETWWFRILSALAMALIISFIYYYRVKNLRKISDVKTEFSRRLIESQENERKRLAGELHDSLSQNLVIIKNRAMLSLTERENVEYAFKQIEEIADVASESLTEVREIAGNLRPFQIDRLGLTKAIEALVRKTNSQQLFVEAKLDNIDKILPAETEINLYRILQESLNNIIKHSGASGAMIEINKAERNITVQVRDNGVGFDPNSNYNIESSGAGFGLTGMSERARIMGSVLVVESTPENGTVIRLKINY